MPVTTPRPENAPTRESREPVKETLEEIPEVEDPILKEIMGKSPRPRKAAGSTKAQEKPSKPIAAKKEPSDSDVTKVWSEILSFTAIIHSTPMLPDLQCDFCKKHILDTAPKTAKDLVELSKDYPNLHSALWSVAKFFGGLSTFGSLTELYDASVIHHAPVPDIMVAVGHIKYPNMPDKKPRTPRPQKSSFFTKGNHRHSPHSESSEGTIASESTFAPGSHP